MHGPVTEHIPAQTSRDLVRKRSARNNVKDNAAKIYEMSDIGKLLYSTDSIRDIRAIIELGVANRSSGLSLIFS